MREERHADALGRVAAHGRAVLRAAQSSGRRDQPYQMDATTEQRTAGQPPHSTRSVVLKLFQELFLVGSRQCPLELRVQVKVVFDGALVATGDEDELLDARRQAFLALPERVATHDSEIHLIRPDALLDEG